MQFQLRVLKLQASAPISMQIEAGTLAHARQLAEQQGFTVLRVEPLARLSLQPRAAQFPLLLFCQELRILLQAGLPLPEVLATLAHKENKAETRDVLLRLGGLVNEGKMLSDALATMPAHFPHLFVASVKACETTGNLPEGLARYSLYLEQVDILRKRLISASIYPTLVLFFGALVLVFLLGYVVPRFSKIYESRTNNLSLASETLLKLGQLVEHHGALILGVLVVTVVGVIGLLAQPSVRAKIGAWVLHLPHLGNRLRVYHLSRLYRTFAMLLRSGIPLVSALSMVNDLLGQTLQHPIQMAQKRISEGVSFSEAMLQFGLTTPVALQLFRAGEKSGQLDAMMEHAASYHEEEMLRWVDAFTKLVEPVLMIGIGLVIGIIVLLMYLPIFELASGIQ
ncbi:MAG: type II secretion system F family protein [Methylotenera sp.]|nr:type II secretion system F family protein [Methylotenera sp.]